MPLGHAEFFRSQPGCHVRRGSLGGRACLRLEGAGAHMVWSWAALRPRPRPHLRSSPRQYRQLGYRLSVLPATAIATALMIHCVHHRHPIAHALAWRPSSSSGSRPKASTSGTYQSCGGLSGALLEIEALAGSLLLAYHSSLPLPRRTLRSSSDLCFRLPKAPRLCALVPAQSEAGTG
jgi:hypothetical protein